MRCLLIPNKMHSLLLLLILHALLSKTEAKEGFAQNELPKTLREFHFVMHYHPVLGTRAVFYNDLLEY